MDVRESSDDDDETRAVQTIGKFDEAIVVRNAEEIKSPASHRPPSSRKISRKSLAGDSSNTLDSPRNRKQSEFRR